MGKRVVRGAQISKVSMVGLAVGFLCLLFVNTWTCRMVHAGTDTGRDPLIDVLIKKGILTEQEAEDIRKEVKAMEKQQEEALVKKIKNEKPVLPEALKGFRVEVLAYLDYSNGKEAESGDTESSFNKFRLTRGYLTVKKEIRPWIRARMTIDTHQDTDGDYKERLKYLYAELRPPDLGFLTGIKSEIGLGHIPWLDFEEHVNPYRCQGTMAIERAGTFNSADTGVSLRGDFGGKLKDAKERTGNHHYDGLYGSWHIGVYNGPGYHTKEQNNNKVIEGRLTWRPMPEILPGLQLSYLGVFGEGNTQASNGDYPDYSVNLAMLSFEHPRAILTAQYFQTQGNAKGTWVDSNGNALDTVGYSFFGKVTPPVLDEKLSLFGRYDHFDQDDDGTIGNNADYDMYIAGLAYDFYRGNLVLVSFETTDYGPDAGQKGSGPTANNALGDDHKVQAVLQIKF
ncbi:MAG: hypothetical protein JRI36_02915 [Deltaproteobacteria bacterium]|nr:hypothetical protein [Deltaproteobacteria bacterium]